MAKEKNKTAEEKQEIRQRWHERCLLNQIKNLLPEGYVVINKKPVQKEIRRISSPETETFWSSWCKDKAGEVFLALLVRPDRVKLIKQARLKEEFVIHSV